MLTKKVLIAGAAILVLSSFFSAMSYCGEEFPEWVPEGAIKEARESLKEFAYFSNEIASGYAKDKLEEVDSTKCKLKNPFEMVCIDFLNYKKGNNIKDLFFRDCLNLEIEKHIGFGIYQGNVCVGEVTVYLLNGIWKEGRSGPKSPKSKILLEEISNMYPVKEGYRIYKIGYFSHTYCVEKDGKIIQIMKKDEKSTHVTSRDTKYVKKDGWEKLPIKQYMLSMKRKIARKIETDEHLRKIYEGRGNDSE